MSVDLNSLRERLPDSLRARLPADGGVLAWLAALGPELADALRELPIAELEAALEELVAAESEALPVLQRLEEGAESKQLRKSVRRNLHRLRSRGLEVGAAPRAERRSVLGPVDVEQEQGAVTAVDPLGRRAVFLMVPVRGGARLYEVLLSDVEGILRLESLEARRREARGFVRRLLREPQTRVLRVEGAVVRTLVRQAQESRSSGAATGVNPSLLAELLRGETAASPGEQARAKLGNTSQRLAEVQAETLLRQRMEQGELPAWPLTGEEVEHAACELAELERSQLVLTAVQKRERAHEVLARAAERILDGVVRERIARRLEEMAAFWLDAGDEEGAAAGVRMAELLRSPRAPLEIGYLSRLLELSCGAAREQQREEDRGKLIVPG